MTCAEMAGVEDWHAPWTTAKSSLRLRSSAPHVHVYLICQLVVSSYHRQTTATLLPLLRSSAPHVHVNLICQLVCCLIVPQAEDSLAATLARVSGELQQMRKELEVALRRLEEARDSEAAARAMREQQVRGVNMCGVKDRYEELPPGAAQCESLISGTSCPPPKYL